MSLDVHNDESQYNLARINKAAIDALRASAQSAEFSNNPLDSMTAEQIREVYEKSQRIHEADTLDSRRLEAAETFIAERPDFVKNSKTAQRMKQYMDAAGLDGSSPDHMHLAFDALVDHGLAVVKRQPATARTRYTQEELESMPLEELRELANAETARSK